MLTNNELCRKILKNSILCQTIEPLGNKSECTTRYQDSSLGTKLEYFLLSGVNSSWAFYDLAKEIIKEGRQPKCILKYAYQAQAESDKNRLGGKVNFGQIQLLIPLITSQVLCFLESGDDKNIKKITLRTNEVLKNTGKEDIHYLEKFIKLGREISCKHHQRLSKKIKVKTTDLSKYSNILQATEEFKHIHIVDEMSSGYLLSLKVLEIFQKNQKRGLLKASEIAYKELRKKIDRFDATADIIVSGMYLIFTKYSKKKLLI